jgi:DNA ligase-4
MSEYADELGENMDVFVLGGWWGKGSRGGKISSLLFGLRNEQEKEYEGQQPTYVNPSRSQCQVIDLFPCHQ